MNKYLIFNCPELKTPDEDPDRILYNVGLYGTVCFQIKEGYR